MTPTRSRMWLAGGLITVLIAALALAAPGSMLAQTGGRVDEDAGSDSSRGPAVVESVAEASCGDPLAWQPIASLNVPRSRLGAAYVSATNKYYVLGGEASGGLRDIPIEEYDLAANAWVTRTNLLVGVSNTGAAAVGNYIYVPGGYSGTAAITRTQRYDPVGNAVTFMADMPAGNYAHAVVAAGNRIYVLGGSVTGVEGVSNYIYDVGANTWLTGTAVPTAVQYAAATYDGKYIYLIGGRTGSTVDLNLVQVYDPVANSWLAGTPLNIARGGPAAFFDGLRVWAVGGGWSSYLTDTEMYANGAWTAGPALGTGARTLAVAYGNGVAIKAGGWTGTYSGAAEMLNIPGTWRLIDPLNVPRSRLGAAYVSATNKYYVLGGEASGGLRDIPIEEYDLAANTWVTRTNLLVGVSNTGAAAVGNYIYVPGGYSGTAAITRTQRYDPVGNAVTFMADMPAGNYAHAVVAAGSRIYVLGGSVTGVEGVSNYIYDVGANTWLTGTAVPVAVQYPAATYDGKYIYLIGGRTGSTIDLNLVQVYDPVANSWLAGTPLNIARGGPAAFFDGLRVWAVGGGWSSYRASAEMQTGGAWVPEQPLNVGARTLGIAYANGVAIKAGGWTGSYSGVAEKLAVCWPGRALLPIVTNGAAAP